MKQIFNTNVGIRVKDVPVPLPDDNQVQVQVVNSLISVGTEAGSMKAKTLSQKYEGAKERVDKFLNFLKKDGLKVAYNKVVTTLSNANVEAKYEDIGYSNSGVVIAKGKNVTKINVGDRVACGGNAQAVHGEVAIIPKNLVVKIPNGVSFEEAAFTTVGSIAMQGIRRSNVKPGENVLIYGTGLIGLIAVQIAKSWGLHIIAIDINDDKLELAKELGADVIINSTTVNNIEEIVNAETNGYGADASIIYASTPSSVPVNSSFSLCREKANIVIVGAVGMDLIRDVFYRKEQNLIISTSYGPGRYDDEYEVNGIDYPIGYVRWTENRNMQEFVSLLNKKRITIDKLLTSVNSADDATKTYQKLASPLNDEIGVLFKFEHDNIQNDFLKIDPIQINSKPISNEQINVGIIGAGEYVKSYILPFIEKNENFNLIGLCNKTSRSSLEVGQAKGFNYITGDYKDLLEDTNIELIIIGTRHDLHSKLTKEALQHGKNVMVEKPLSLTVTGVEEIIEEIKKSNKKVFVGFNRRYSKLIQAIKSNLLERTSPIMINFRINAGNIPLNSWVQDPNVGGGRIIGEGCHFIDLCNYIVNSEIVSFKIQSIAIDNKRINADDNFVIVIKYEDGSLSNIVYTSVGGGNQPKEQLEVFCDGESYVIDDFNTYTKYSKSDTDRTVLKEQDKGREQQIHEIMKSLQGKDSLVPVVNFDLNASLLAILAQEKLYGN